MDTECLRGVPVVMVGVWQMQRGEGVCDSAQLSVSQALKTLGHFLEAGCHSRVRRTVPRQLTFAAYLYVTNVWRGSRGLLIVLVLVCYWRETKTFGSRTVG